jgi:hypothetical protein
MVGKRLIILLAIVTGVALELGIHAISGRREAWDSPQFWTIGLPLAGLAALAMGFLARDRDWTWSAIVVPSQVLTMIVRSGDLGFGLWPLTVALSTILSAPFVFAAFLGSRLRPDSSVTRPSRR